mmetsp:Transcript_48722/g.155746  ORF Transcript_48722/g.155746 Transcript_48722/m.155746 type:complete len:279 (+) Transcript_48722:385-1221(+)
MQRVEDREVKPSVKLPVYDVGHPQRQEKTCQGTDSAGRPGSEHVDQGQPLPIVTHRQDNRDYGNNRNDTHGEHWSPGPSPMLKVNRAQADVDNCEEPHGEATDAKEKQVCMSRVADVESQTVCPDDVLGVGARPHEHVNGGVDLVLHALDRLPDAALVGTVRAPRVRDAIEAVAQLRRLTVHLPLTQVARDLPSREHQPRGGDQGQEHEHAPVEVEDVQAHPEDIQHGVAARQDQAHLNADALVRLVGDFACHGGDQSEEVQQDDHLRRSVNTLGLVV